ncbi:MAG: nuclear transport factor 2 family protein [Woeseiaceae bacterium]
MNLHNVLRLIVSGVLLLGFTSVLAQTDEQVNDQADVWAQVELQWNLVEKNDSKWTEKLLTEDFSGWGKGSPAPRNKASTKMWTRFNNETSQMVAHELYPLSIVVHDDVAIAHYLYSSATKKKDKDGKIESTNGRYTDILVRTDNGWKFIAWSGGADD